MDNSVNTVNRTFEHNLSGRIPKGELWLGTDLIQKAGLEDNLEGHLTLANRLGHDVLCLPISINAAVNKTLGYRYFNLEELEEMSRISDLFLIPIIDGPFQRITEKKGLMFILDTSDTD